MMKLFKKILFIILILIIIGSISIIISNFKMINKSSPKSIDNKISLIEGYESDGTLWGPLC